jgi:hypothetical protein
VYAHYGKGVYIYTGLSFFRELPAGVPGAYRLFVNLLSQTQHTQAQQSASLGEQTKLTFKRGMSGDLLRDGTVFGFTDYAASDGICLKVIYNTFHDPSQAAEIFQKEIAESKQVLNRTKKLNAKQEIVGERAELLLGKPDGVSFAVLWTDGRSVHEIQSSSLPHILTLEKVYSY